MWDHFFPSAAFAWLFYVLLVGVTLIASYTDVRRMVVPKWLTVPALALGLLMNVLRGAWVAAQADTNVWIGAKDGLLFALYGFALSFGLFFVMWILGTCRGGDVKLFGALGAWLGPVLSVFVLIGTIVVILVYTMGRLLWWAFGTTTVVQGGTPSGSRKDKKALTKQDYEQAKRLRQRLIYSPALACATALVVFWVFHKELCVPLAPAKPAESEQRG